MKDKIVVLNLKCNPKNLVKSRL